MEINLEIWLSAPNFLTDFDFAPPLARFLEWKLKLHDVITKNLKLYCVLLEMYYQTCTYSFLWELPTIPSSAETVLTLPGLILALEHVGYFCSYVNPNIWGSDERTAGTKASDG